MTSNILSAIFADAHQSNIEIKLFGLVIEQKIINPIVLCISLLSYTVILLIYLSLSLDTIK